MVLKALIFDLDGTLLDTIEDIQISLNSALTQMGFPTYSIDQVKRLVGEGVEELVRKALPENCRSKHVFEGCLRILRSEYERSWMHHTAPYPGVPETLTRLNRIHAPFSVLSNKPDDFTVKMIKSMLPSWEFKVIQGSVSGIARKPDPAAALKIAEIMGATPENVLFIGDSDIDMLTAVHAGMIPVGVLWGFRSECELRRSGARHIIAHPSEIIRFFE